MADAPVPQSPDSPPDAIGPYTILNELGRGGMGGVYRARDSRLHRDVVALRGIGPAKAAEYGEAIVSVIRGHS